MSSRRNGSVSRAAEAASKNRLHMDRNPQHSRITDPSNPAGRRKEIDNVMKRARQASPGSWDRKLLEVEEKDPNRWRHTGYKQMYLEGGRSVSPRRSRSPIAPRRVSRSPLGRRSRSPVSRRKSRSPRRTPRRSPRRTPVRRTSPAVRSPRRRSPRPRSPLRRESPRARSPPRRESPRPRARVAPPARRPPSPPGPRKLTVGSAVAGGGAQRAAARAPAAPPRAAPPPARLSSPPGPRTSTSSSGSSCSDESCSVCSAKNKKAPPPPPPKGAKVPPRPTSKSPVRARPGATSGARAVQPTRELLKARETSKRSREEKVLEWQRSQLAVRPAAPVQIPAVHIKREGSAGPPTDPRRRPRVSPAAIAAALNDSDSDSDSEPSDEHQPQRLTLSERFGKMAQWSADRSARLENMRITRRETRLHVRIERDADEPAAMPGVEPVAPEGSYPEELLASAPGGLPSWDDVTVRYEYYKKRGYLRGLTLGDYVKWEEWWYKYQEWLERERAYERWAEEEARPTRRDRRRKGGRHRRS